MMIREVFNLIWEEEGGSVLRLILVSGGACGWRRRSCDKKTFLKRELFVKKNIKLLFKNNNYNHKQSFNINTP